MQSIMSIVDDRRLKCRQNASHHILAPVLWSIFRFRRAICVQEMADVSVESVPVRAQTRLRVSLTDDHVLTAHEFHCDGRPFYCKTCRQTRPVPDGEYGGWAIHLRLQTSETAHFRRAYCTDCFKDRWNHVENAEVTTSSDVMELFGGRQQASDPHVAADIVPYGDGAQSEDVLASEDPPEEAPEYTLQLTDNRVLIAHEFYCDDGSFVCKCCGQTRTVPDGDCGGWSIILCATGSDAPHCGRAYCTDCFVGKWERVKNGKVKTSSDAKKLFSGQRRVVKIHETLKVVCESNEHVGTVPRCPYCKKTRKDGKNANVTWTVRVIETSGANREVSAVIMCADCYDRKVPGIRAVRTVADCLRQLAPK